QVLFRRTCHHFVLLYRVRPRVHVEELDLTERNEVLPSAKRISVWVRKLNIWEETTCLLRPRPKILFAHRYGTYVDRDVLVISHGLYPRSYLNRDPLIHHANYEDHKIT